ncbi:transcriptional regulator [Kitasatospora sp. NBC_00070]|uniref:AfsR/SARP family transcriptional regulator n=1 Tax=Kitasatospora sp. NBC_00070 TaxID=2975962 RepID=UPI00325607C7
MEFGILGPLLVWDAAGRAVPVGGPRDRRVLAALLLAEGRTVGLARLAAAVWADPPVTAREQLLNVAAGLRRTFAVHAAEETVRMVRQDAGLQLSLGPGRLDRSRFSALLARAGRESADGRYALAADQLREALALWRGPALGGLDGPVFRAEAAVLEEQRLDCLEQLAEVEAALGLPNVLGGELARLAVEHPLRERFAELQLLALYRAGRRPEALAVFSRARQALAEQAGLDPGPGLVRLHRAVLADDPALLPGAGAGAGAGTGPGAPAPAVLPVPSQLPPAPAVFVDREVELAELVRALGTPSGTVPSALVTGQPGVGKTALALHAAHRLSPAFPDGRLFADLRGAGAGPARPGEVLGGFLRALGVDGRSLPTGTAERAAAYRTLLAGRRVLVVLDNAADEAQLAPLLPGTPGCAVLVTSRRRLTGQDHRLVLPLGVLDEPAALALLARVAGHPRIAGAPGDARRLAGLCGHLPLALRVTAAKLAAHPHRSLADLVARLTDERDRLEELSHGGVGVRAGLSLSYRALPAPARTLLRGLALLDAPDSAAWTAAAVLDRPAGATDRQLDLLVGDHLLEPVGRDPAGQTRYRLHDLVRAFARERAAVEDPPEQRAAVLDRVLRCWVTLARAGRRAHQGADYPGLPHRTPDWLPDDTLAGPARTDPVGWLRAEQEALVATVRQAAGPGPDLPSGAAAACWELAATGEYVFDLRSDLDGWRPVQEVGLAAARACGDRVGVAVLLVGLGRQLATHEQWRRARDTLDLAERIFRELGDPHGAAYASWVLSYLDRMQGRPAEALRRCRRDAAAFRAAGEAYGEAQALRGIGQLLLAEGRTEQALDVLREALAVAGRTGAEWPRICLVRWIAEAEHRAGQLAEAQAGFAEVLAHTDALGDLAGQSGARIGLGRVALDRGDRTAALEHLRAAAELGRRSRHTVVSALAALPLAEALAASGDRTGAEALLAEAADACRRMGTRPLLARIDALRDALAPAGAGSA